MPGIPEDLRLVLSELPFTLAETIEGYAASVSDSAKDIFEEAGLRDHYRASEEDFVFGAAIRRLWSLIDSQYQTLLNSLTLLERQEVRIVRLGGARYFRGSPAFDELRDLRQDLSDLLHEQEIYSFAVASSLTELAQMVVESGS